MNRVIVIGGGIVGTAIAAELAVQGADILLITDRGVGRGATAAGMGHLVALDGHEDKMALTLHSLALWEDLELTENCERNRCGTLWVAENQEEMELASSMKKRFARKGISAELVTGDLLPELEPELREGLMGGLMVFSDSAIYPPNAANLFWRWAESHGAKKKDARVVELGPKTVLLSDGSHLHADWVVVATGDRSAELLPGLPTSPRKGHLLITACGSQFLKHQVVELGYGKTTESKDAVSVACNVQPRPRGQVLIGSSRQEGCHDSSVEPKVVYRMLRRALDFFPRLSDLTALRIWTGFRAATPDGAPIVGILDQGLAVATGHEGLGVTQAPGTARLLSQLLTGDTCFMDPSPFDPHRFTVSTL